MCSWGKYTTTSRVHAESIQPGQGSMWQYNDVRGTCGKYTTTSGTHAENTWPRQGCMRKVYDVRGSCGKYKMMSRFHTESILPRQEYIRQLYNDARGVHSESIRPRQGYIRKVWRHGFMRRVYDHISGAYDNYGFMWIVASFTDDQTNLLRRKSADCFR